MGPMRKGLLVPSGTNVVLVIAALCSCVSEAPSGGDAGPDSSKPAGTEGAPCLPGDQCVGGLLCLSGFCVRPDSGAPVDGSSGDGSGGMDCGAPKISASIACGANSCDPLAADVCCMTGKFCYNLDGGSCSQPWACNQQAHCGIQVCCYVNGGTMGGCPIQTNQMPVTKCLVDPNSCEGVNQGRMLCATNNDCMLSIFSKTCRPMLDPGGNIVGICSP